MSKTFKILFIVGASLFLLGSVLFVAVFAMSGWNIAKLGDASYQHSTYALTDDITSIIINSNTADISIIPAKDTETKVECFESTNEKHTVSVKNGVLSISIESKKWYENINLFSFKSPKITIYLPKNEYKSLSINEDTGEIDISKDFVFENIDIKASTGNISCLASASGNIKIATSTGDISLSGVSADAVDLSTSTGNINASTVNCIGDLKLKVSTGKTSLQDVNCNNISSLGDTGDITMKNVLVNGKMYIERSTGYVKLDRCDATDIEIITDTGDVSGSVRTEKTFFADSDTGNVSVPKTVSDEICNVTTDTGSITLTVSP